MDIFNRKRIEELEDELYEAECERVKYRRDIELLTKRLEAMGALEESIPEGCTKGPWCRACEFSRTFHYSPYNSVSYTTFYTCSKGKSCENFVQKKEN